MRSLLPLLGAFFVRFSGAAKSVDVIDRVLTDEECDYYAQIEVDPIKSSMGRMHGNATLPAPLIERIHEAAGEECSESHKLEDVSVKTSLMDESTKLHVDHVDNGGPTWEEVNGDVVFVFLKDNDKASFVYEGEEIPVKAGTMVKFNGNGLHNTIIQDGSVHLLGPFELDSFKYVSDTPSPAPINACGSSPCASLPCLNGGTCTDLDGCAFICTCTPENTGATCDRPVTPQPTLEPTPSPTNDPTPSPTKDPTPSPTNAQTPSPTKVPTPSPTKDPTPSPTNAPTPSPTKDPTPNPISNPPQPSPKPTFKPGDRVSKGGRSPKGGKVRVPKAGKEGNSQSEAKGSKGKP